MSSDLRFYFLYLRLQHGGCLGVPAPELLNPHNQCERQRVNLGCNAARDRLSPLAVEYQRLQIGLAETTVPFKSGKVEFRLGLLNSILGNSFGVVELQQVLQCLDFLEV